MNARPLTARQRQVLDFIRESTAANGFAPTIREIGDRLGIRSPNGVQQHLRLLEKKGFLNRRRKSGRTLTVVTADDGKTIPFLGKVS
jgi:repressor LexA